MDFPFPQDVIKYSVDDALTHIANDYILRTVRQIFRSEGREPARKFLKEQIRYYGSYGPGRPGLEGTPSGIRTRYEGKSYTVTWSEVLKRALRPTYLPRYKQVEEDRLLEYEEPERVERVVEELPPLEDVFNEAIRFLKKQRG